MRKKGNVKFGGNFQMLVCWRRWPGNILLHPEGATRWQHFGMFRIHPGAASQGAGGPRSPVRSTSSLVFRRLRRPSRDAVVLSPRGESRDPEQKACLSMANTSAVSTQLALNSSACWPVATSDVGLDCRSLSEKRMLCGGQGTV